MRMRSTAALILFLGLTAASLPDEMHPSLAPYADIVLPASPPEPGRLRLRYMGVSTLVLDDGDRTILLDGFFSHPGKKKVARSRLEPNEASIEDGLRRAGISRLDMILTAHSHYDHAMDAGFIAKHKGALLVGTSSTAWIGRSAGVGEESICTIGGGNFVTVGRFRISAIATRHAFPNLAPGRIRQRFAGPVHAFEYKDGGSLSFLIEHDGLKILIHSTAGFARGDMAGVKADLVLLGVGGIRPYVGGYKSYWEELVQQTGAALVIPIHWDNFFLGLDQPLTPMRSFAPSMRALEKLAADDGRTLALMPPFAPVDIGPPTRLARERLQATIGFARQYGGRSPARAESEVRCPQAPVHRRSS